MSQISIEVIHSDVGNKEDGSNNVIGVDYDDSIGQCNGSNAANWNNILEFTGSPGNWTASFKNSKFAEVYEIL